MSISPTSILRGLLAAAAGAGLVVGAMQAPGDLRLDWPGTEKGPGSSSASARAAEATDLVCVGQELSGVAGVSSTDLPGTLAAAAAPEGTLGGLTLPTGAGSVTMRTLGGDRIGEVLGRRGLTASAAYTQQSPLEIQARGPLAPGAAGVQTYLAGGTLRGLGASPCGRPSADMWLVAGGGQAGRQERLVLANPGENPVTVDIELHGAAGPIESPTGRNVVVPPRGRTAVLLDGISSSEKSPVAHVSATGGVVRAVAADVWTDGTHAAGIDDAAPTAAPARTVTIPGAVAGTGGTLRIAVPGERDAVVQARALTAKGRAALASGVTRVKAGAVADVDLGSFPKDAVAIQLSADVPVVAGALVLDRPSAGGSGDLAWAAGAEAITTLAGMPLTAPAGAPSGLERTLVLAGGQGDSTMSVTTTAGGKETTRTVAVPADTAQQVDLGEADAVWVRPTSGRASAAVVTRGAAEGQPLITVVPLAESPVMAAATTLVPVEQ
ncbi:MAG: DUF5719 family protein [Micrococcales bacterium]|nr:DUF5719 family protein [Micrococcales bacterium]